VLADVIDYLRCPHCGDTLRIDGPTVRCPSGHSFDVARQGYVNLRRGHAPARTADSPTMVQARAAFLGAGHLAALTSALTSESVRLLRAADVPGCIVDVGAGTGHHLAALLDRLTDRAGVALDASAPALRRAARAHPRIGAAACDAWASLPVADGVAALALSAFAPRNGAELARILHPDGGVVVATPTGEHFAELVEALGLIGVEAAVAMGPSAHHVDDRELARRVAALPEPLAVTASVTLSVYRRR
jgi:23S rRNA (guanine745-N1)-methyltransferase